MTNEVIVDTVRSYSSGIIGRAMNTARGNTYPIDSSSKPGDAPTTIESFLSGISACGVTLIELYAQENEVPLDRLEVTIEGVRAKANPANFQAIKMRFEFAGVDQARAEQLVETYKGR